MNKIKFVDLMEAFEMHGPEDYYFYQPSTGEVIWRNDDVEPFTEEDEELLADCIALPESDEIDEYSMMEEFINQLDNSKQQARLSRAISGRGAFRYFKDEVADLGIRQAWFDFRDKAYKGLAREWAKENGVQIIDELNNPNEELLKK